MNKRILNVINELKNLRHLTPASKNDVLKAEAALGLSLAEEYKDYVLSYGVITAKKVDITGVCESKRLSVVDVTLEEKNFNSDIPADMYVIESTGIEGIVILQDSLGSIYRLNPGRKPEKIFDCLADYLLDLQKE